MLSFRIYPQQNLLTVVAEGVIELTEFLQFFHSLLHEPGYKVGMDCFWDARRVTGAEGNVELYQQAAEFICDDTVFTEPSRTAIIIPNDNRELLQYSEGFLLMASSSMIDHRIFTEDELDDALAFLRLTKVP